MSDVAIPLGAGLAGGFLLGPSGFVAGWTIGSAYAAGRKTIEQDGLEDLTFQTSTYGVTLPYVVGKSRVAGNIIWADTKREHSDTYQETKFSPNVEVLTYTLSFAIALCRGPILGISRVWADGKLVVDARVDPNLLPGQLYLGSDTQLPDPTMEAALGAGNVPAYRGIAYMVMTDLNLGTTGRVPQFSFEVIGPDFITAGSF